MRQGRCGSNGAVSGSPAEDEEGWASKPLSDIFWRQKKVAMRTAANMLRVFLQRISGGRQGSGVYLQIRAASTKIE
ncbi:hypothetical protein PoB_000326600 [Plakobranchus ocellatus]|uniref:Uncharacterized protein n=1 Tax=Plakobranchus ocellatus TaxID=259542 RepID=A0AAV3XHP4_9GAST|nr:hypothetical protein PoB_000326600 [Plakobranchus ocellatus]